MLTFKKNKDRFEINQDFKFNEQICAKVFLHSHHVQPMFSVNMSECIEHSHQISLNSHEMELYQNHLIIIRKMSFSIPSSLRLGNIMITKDVQL